MWQALAGGAALGALGGLFGNKSKSSTSVNVGSAGQSEREGGRVATEQLKILEDLIARQNVSETADIDLARQEQNRLLARLKEMAVSGGLPSQQQYEQGRAIAEQQFAPQQVAFRQQLEQRERETARRAGMLGRTSSDPILQAKLAQEQARGMERLQAEQQAAATQYALALPQQQLQYQQMASQLTSGLASQALQNRQTLLGLGSSMQQAGQSFRAQTASRDTVQTSGGGLGGAITGALGGASAGFGLMQAFRSFGKSDSNSVPTTNTTSGFGNYAQPYSEFKWHL